MAFVKVPTRTASSTKDPRVFSVPGISKPLQITLDGDGECKGLAIGAGKYAEFRIQARDFALLKPEVVKAAEAASDAVNKAMKAGQFESKDAGGFLTWTYKG